MIAQDAGAALVFIQDERAITVPVGFDLLIDAEVFHWDDLTAASVITMLPVVGLYLFIHRWMVEGLTAGSVEADQRRSCSRVTGRAPG